MNGNQPEKKQDQENMTAEFLRDVENVVQDLQAAPRTEKPLTLAMRRRRGGTPFKDDTLVMTITERDGAFFVDQGIQMSRYGGARKRSPRAVLMGGKVIKDVPLARLDRNNIGQVLETLDQKLTGNYGLHQIKVDSLEPINEFPQNGRVLLFIHGTFSKIESLFAELQATPEGRDFLGRANGHGYQQVLGFNHPTLSVSPILNAQRLTNLIGNSKAHIDVICHSRGGLVTRWWLEAFDRADPTKRRVVFVASPLKGTGLAAPTNLRASLSLIATMSNALKQAGMLLSGTNPFLAFVTGVFQIVASITNLAAKTPAIDAAISLIPGLAAMSRVGNNQELLRLREHSIDLRKRYFAITSNFETEKVGWEFWKIFRRPKQKLLNRAADFVFDGDNDLVVDTSSMTNIGEKGKEEAIELPDDQVFKFGTNDRVHHTNYFRQPDTLNFITEKLQIP